MRIQTIAAFLMLISLPLAASEGDEAFARLGDIVLTQDMIDAALSRIPEESRLTYIRDGKNIDLTVKNILTNMALAKQAREAGYHDDPIVAGRIALAENRELAEVWLEERVRNAEPADYEGLAREYYLLNSGRFMAPETWDVTHLLIKTESRSEEEARALARDLWEKSVSEPESFDQLVAEYSEDRTVASSKGRLTGIESGKTVKPFEDAFKEIRNVGEFSSVVETVFGFHIIRLDALHPPRQQTFEEVKVPLIKAQQSDYMDKLRRKYAAEAVASQPFEYPEGAIEAMLKRYFGENLEKAPQYGN